MSIETTPGQGTNVYAQPHKILGTHTAGVKKYLFFETAGGAVVKEPIAPMTRLQAREAYPHLSGSDVERLVRFSQRRELQPDGTIKTSHPRWAYGSEYTTRRGRWLRDDYFSVDQPGFADRSGHLAADVFVELMSTAKEGYGHCVRMVLADATKAMTDAGCKHNKIAVEFMRLVAQAVKFAALNAPWQAWVSEVIEAKARDAAEQKKRMQRLTERSIAVRKAKAEAKRQAASQQGAEG